MKVAVAIARVVLGLIFVVFGLNGFLHFLPLKPPTGVLAAQFRGALDHSHYLVPIFALQVIGGALLLSGRYVPLALVLLGPIVVNVLLYHGLLDPKGLPQALVVTVLWLVVFASARKAFSNIFKAEPLSG